MVYQILLNTKVLSNLETPWLILHYKIDAIINIHYIFLWLDLSECLK